MSNFNRLARWLLGRTDQPTAPTILVEVIERDSLEGEIIGRYDGLSVGQAERLADDLNEFCQNWLRQECPRPVTE